MSIIFQLFCAEDLQKLEVKDLEGLKARIAEALGLQESETKGALQKDEAGKASPQGPPALSLKISSKTELSEDAPSQIKEALNKRFHEVSQQLKSTQPRQSFNFDRLRRRYFDQRDPEDEKKENMILEWAISCEVNNFEFYKDLLRAKEAADQFFFDKTGQRPKGPDSLYSPFSREHPLYKLYYGLSDPGSAPSQGTAAPSS